MEKSENEEGKPRDLFGIGCVFWMVAWLFLHSLLTTCHKVMFLQRFLTGQVNTEDHTWEVAAPITTVQRVPIAKRTSDTGQTAPRETRMLSELPSKL